MRDIFKSEDLLTQELSFRLRSNQTVEENSSDFDLIQNVASKKIKFQPAAVLLPIVFDKSGPSVVFTRRAKHLKHHAGQIAFPGGKVEDSDGSEINTAIRECFEEIYLESTDIKILGILPRHDTFTGYSIRPFVALITNFEKLKPELDEVSCIFKIPLKFLLIKKNMRLHSVRSNGHHRAYYSIPYGPFYIWGATARIVKTFSDLIQRQI